MFCRVITLSIEPGTIVSWEYHNNNIRDVGALITLPADRVSFENGPRPSAKLLANGTADEPIVFTSSRSPKRAGDWGGIILAGDAPNTLQNGNGRVEGLPQFIRYGGNNSGDNSGSLKYIRIEYVGFGFAPGSEINGLSLYSVGSETTLEHIQVYKSTDDGFEWFGGTVNSKYLVSMYSDDDSFDMDQGWSGHNQFWFAVQSDGADNGFEADGGNSNSNNTMLPGPTIFNATIIGHGAIEGNDKGSGMNFRNNFRGEIQNSLIYNFGGAPWSIDEVTLPNYDEGILALENIIVYQNGPWINDGAGRFAGDYLLIDPEFSNLAAPDFNYTPNAGAAKLGSTPHSVGFFDTSATYIGAFDPDAMTLWIYEGIWVRTKDD